MKIKKDDLSLLVYLVYFYVIGLALVIILLKKPNNLELFGYGYVFAIVLILIDVLYVTFTGKELPIRTRLTKITALILSVYAIFVMAKIMYDYSNQNQPTEFKHSDFLTAIGGLGVGLSILMYVEQKESSLFRKDEEKEEKEDKNK
jgi:mannose/fructose/N-acetylgalactosamine-specific phosphotransferase system component IIC